MKKDMNAGLEREDDSYFELNGKALIGDPQAVSFFMNEIEKYLRKTPFIGKLPEAYRTAAEALFHEWKGFGPAYRWFTDRAYSESTRPHVLALLFVICLINPLPLELGREVKATLGLFLSWREWCW